MRALAPLLTLASLGCGEPPEIAHSYSLAITQTAIRNLVGPGVPGMNLDGRVSDATDDLTCQQEDAVDPLDEEVGVDNALGGSIDLLLVNPRPQPFDPPVLVDLEIRAPAELENAERVVVTLGGVELPAAEVVDGRFQAIGLADSALTFELPFDDEPAIPITLLGPAVQGRIAQPGEATEGGLSEGGELLEMVVGGRLDVDATIDAATEAAPDLDASLLRTTFESVADLDPDADGVCQSVSVAILAEVTDG